MEYCGATCPLQYRLDAERDRKTERGIEKDGQIDIERPTYRDVERQTDTNRDIEGQTDTDRY